MFLFTFAASKSNQSKQNILCVYQKNVFLIVYIGRVGPKLKQGKYCSVVILKQGKILFCESWNIPTNAHVLETIFINQEKSCALPQAIFLIETIWLM